MIDTKKLGRPRGFDYDTALQSAMEVFWAKGFEGASLRDLTGAMKITGPSLYAAFGDKRGLFLKTIDHYCAADACTPLVEMEAAEDIEDALHRFLSEVIRCATQHDSGAKGCFLASSAVASAGQVEGVAKRVEAAIAEAQARLTARFNHEIEKGTLPKSFPSKERASMLFDLQQGYMFRARAGLSHTQMQDEIPGRVRTLLMHQ